MLEKYWRLDLKGGARNHAVVAVGQKLYSFGGFCDHGYHSFESSPFSVQVFNTVALRWMPTVTPGTEERPHEVPCARHGHTAVLIEDTIYVCWGVNWTWEPCNDLHAFNVDTDGWSKPLVSGTVPKGRAGHSACVLGKVMYVYGGWNKPTGHTNAMYKLDTSTMVWSLINTRGTLPASSWHSATFIGTQMFVFGGRGDRDKMNDNVSVFDTETNSCQNTPTHRPQGRWYHSAFAYNGELYIFGGYRLECCLRSLYIWKLTPETFSWKKVLGLGMQQCFFSKHCCMVGDRVFFTQGYQAFYKHRHDGSWNGVRRSGGLELMVLELHPTLKTLCKLAVIQHGLEQSGLTHDVRWELAAMATSRVNGK